MKIELISPRAVKGYLKDEMVTFIDIRTREEYNRKHIRNAKNIPLCELDEALLQLDHTPKYVLYCDRGAASLTAAGKMQAAGFRVCSINGGIRAFERMSLE